MATPPNQPDRRALVLRLASMTALVGTCSGVGAFAGSAGKEVVRLATRIDAVCGALRGETISVRDWRAGVQTLFSRVPLDEVMGAIDFDRVASRIGFASLGVTTARISLESGDVRNLSFITKLFAVDRSRAIIPHGHANMVSAHLPLSGAFRLRQYDQIERDSHALTVRQTEDRRLLPGDLSSIGEEADNVHWFVAEEPAHTFDVIVTGLDPAAQQDYEIFNLDMEAAVPRGSGLLQVPRMSVEDALRKYG